MDLQLQEFCANFVFPNFNDQAQRMQYAALFLFTSRDVQDLQRFRCLPILTNLTNSDQPYYPYFGYVNYVVANYNRERDFHAEETLSNRFEEVLSGFRERNGANPAAMLLYTYYYPCGDCAIKILSKLDIGVRLHLAYSEYSRDWTDMPLVETILDQSFVHMFRVRNASHRPPEEYSSSEEETSESEDEEFLEMVEDFRRRGRAQGRGRYSRRFMRGRGRFAVGRRGGGNFRGGYRGRGRGRGGNRARRYRARWWQ